MPLFYFVLNNGRDKFPDPDGVELADEEAARSHAISVARELMRHRGCHVGSWRLEVCDDYLNSCFEILFAEADDGIGHLRPEYRETVERVARSTASLHDAMTCVRSSVDQLKQTLARPTK